MKNLLLIDSTVTDYQTFVDSVNTDTLPFVYRSSTTVPFTIISIDPSNIPIQDPYVHEEATTRQALLDFLGDTTIDRIGIVFTMNANVFLEGETFFQENNLQFMIDLIQTYQVKHIDYFACNTLQYPEWNDYYAKISETGVIVGASNNKTGNLQYGGDWVLESTNQDVEFIYFTNTIEYYKYLLDTSDTGFSTVVIKNGYNLWGSGSNAKNQLGSLGSATQIMSYNDFSVLTTIGNFVRVACSVNFTYCLSGTSGGVGIDYWVYASGSNADGQLGTYSGIQFALAGPSRGGNGYQRAIAAGEFFVLYQDDDPITRGAGAPTSAYAVTNAASWLACGRGHSLFIFWSNKFLYGIGLNSNYQLGTGSTNQVGGITLLSSNLYVAISCGSYHSLALRDDGTIWGSGLNSSNQLGSLYGSNTTFVQISPANKIFVAIAAGETHSLALNIDGTVWGTGSNTYNQLGNMYGSNTTFAQLTPTGTAFRQVSCGSYGSYHSLALDSNGNLWGTGLNTSRQLGAAYGSNTTFTQLLTGVVSLPNLSPVYFDVIYITYLFSLSASVNVLSGNSLTIYGTNLASVAYVTFGGVQVQASSFTTKNQFQIVFTVPSTGNFTNYVTINVAGTNYPATNSDVNKTQGTTLIPTITTITQAANGLITMNGTNLVSPTVTMTGGYTSGTITSVSSSQLTFTPNTFISSSTFTVTVSGNSASLAVTFPTINTITQSANGVITINGTTFASPTVTISGFTSGIVTKVNSTQLTFTPNAFIGSATFTLTDSGNGVAYTASFPTITSITQAANKLVTINGSNFNSPSPTVTIPGYTPGTVTKVSSSQLTFNPNTLIGTSTFTVTDSGSSVAYVYSSSLPTITSFTPVIGSRNTKVTILGTNLKNVTSILFGSVVATNPTITPTIIIVNAPPNVKSVTITLNDSSGYSISTTTLYTYNTNPTLFTNSIGDTTYQLLSQLSLTDGIADTGVLNLGSATTPINFSGPTYGVTMTSSDNSSALATTAFVKSQGYSTGSLTGYAQLAVAQTWSALQTFSSGIQSSAYNALTATSNVSVGSNLTTGTLSLGTSTATMNLNVPLTPTYTAASVSGQIGYTVYLPPLDTVTYQFSGGDLVYRYVPIVQGTYVVTGAVTPAITLDYFIIYFAALKVTPAAGLDVTTYSATDKLTFFAGLKSTPLPLITNIIVGGTTWSTTSSMYIPAGYTTLALVTNTYKAGTPNSKINTTMTVTRIA